MVDPDHRIAADRKHIGNGWTRYQLRSMQIVLQASQGIVSGNPEFFRYAFGDTYQDYADILMMPHDYIFNRSYYREGTDRNELDAYLIARSALAQTDKAELLHLLSSSDPAGFIHLHRQTDNGRLRNILPFYIPKPKDHRQTTTLASPSTTTATPNAPNLPDDERVEDAGLDFLD